MKESMWRPGLLFLTLSLCAVAAGAALRVDLIWFGYIRHSDLAANLPVFLFLHLVPVGIYAASALACRHHSGMLATVCVCSVLAAGMWLLAVYPTPEVRDPDLDMGLRGLCVGIPHFFLGFVVGVMTLILRPWREPRRLRVIQATASDLGKSGCP